MPAAILFAVPAMKADEVLAMRADLAMYTLQGRADFVRRFAPGVAGGGDAAEPTMERMGDGTVRMPVKSWADIDAAMRRCGGKR